MNGTDIEGGGVEWNNLSRAIDQGLATESRLDEAVRRSFKPQFDVGRFDPANVAIGGKVIKCRYPLNVLKDTCDHSCY
jgi:hypothetical protein